MKKFFLIFVFLYTANLNADQALYGSFFGNDNWAAGTYKISSDGNEVDLFLEDYIVIDVSPDSTLLLCISAADMSNNALDSIAIYDFDSIRVINSLGRLNMNARFLYDNSILFEENICVGNWDGWVCDSAETNLKRYYSYNNMVFDIANRTNSIHQSSRTGHRPASYILSPDKTKIIHTKIDTGDGSLSIYDLQINQSLSIQTTLTDINNVYWAGDDNIYALFPDTSENNNTNQLFKVEINSDSTILTMLTNFDNEENYRMASSENGWYSQIQLGQQKIILYDYILHGGSSGWPPSFDFDSTSFTVKAYDIQQDEVLTLLEDVITGWGILFQPAWSSSGFKLSLPFISRLPGGETFIPSGIRNFDFSTNEEWTIQLPEEAGIPYCLKWFKTQVDDSSTICTAADGTEGVELWGECYSIENTDSLYSYEIQGSIPLEIGNLINLTYLSLSDGLTGVIPPEIGNLINLTYLELEGELTGVIPPEISNLTNLTYLDLGYQYLEGSIPPEIYNLTNLTHLYLNDNALTGYIPLEIGNLTNLTHLYLNNNELSGEIPLEIGNLTNLTHLYLEINALAGSIPPEIGNLTSLTELMLYANQLTGSIPSEIGNLNNLVYLGLVENQLTGEIPESFESLSQLTAFGLSENYLSGNIPEFICNIFSNCFLFDISSNSFCPPYPSCIEDYVGEQNWGGCDILACSLGVVYVSEGHNSGDPEDYIELYNSGDEDCSLQGFQLDDSEELDDLTFGNVIIPAGGYWLGYEDAESSFSSGLSGSGDLIVLADSTGSSLIVELEVVQETDSISYSQSFDANGNGCYTIPTPGSLNGECVTLSTLQTAIPPREYSLSQNYPNPFNPTTQIRYDLPEDALVSISIYDVMGRKIKSLSNANQTAGYHSLQWDATNDIGEGVSAGMYIYTIQAGEYRSTKKMVLLK